MDQVEMKWQSLEPGDIFSARCKQFKEAQKIVWLELVGSCKGEPAVLLRSVPEFAGALAWKTLEDGYGSVALTTTIALLDKVLDYKPGTKVRGATLHWVEGANPQAQSSWD
jgi:hypothetical protein